MTPRPDALKRIAAGFRIHPVEGLGLEHLWVVFPEGPEYPLDKRITAMPMKSVPHLVQRLKRKRR